MNNPPAWCAATVDDNRTVFPGVNVIWLEAPEIAGQARPGQFVMVKCRGQTFLRRPLSIHRLSFDKNRLAFMFAVVGKGTAWLAGIKPGEVIDLLGPLGNGFIINSGVDSAVLIAGGLGMAPLGFLADELKAQGKKVKILYGTATASQMCPESTLPAAVEYVYATEDGSRGRNGFITEYLPQYLQGTAQLFACGPTPMYRTMAKMTTVKNKPVQVSLEVRMACGLGICYGCSIHTKQGLRQVCKHGPVFNLHDIEWNEFSDI